MQPVYDKHAARFNGLQRGEAVLPWDQTSIPISKTCTRASDELVYIEELDITDPLDRLAYYKRLMNRMLSQGGGATGSW